MPTFTPGWNAGTLLWIIGAIGGLCGGAYVTARYSLLGKILAISDKQRTDAERGRESIGARMDLMDGKLHVMEAELFQSRAETLIARNEVLALKQENIRLFADKARVEDELANMRIRNRQLEIKCEELRQQVEILHPGSTSPPGDIADVIV